MRGFNCVPFISCTAVSLGESALKELFEKQQSGVEPDLETRPISFLEDVVLSSSEKQVDLGVLVDSEKRSDPANHHRHMDGHHLHLSSCHECLELENSTIQSVRCASVENIPDLPDDLSCPGGEEEQPDDSWRKHRGARGKPPNVLIFTGVHEERYEVIRSLLTECIDTERYTVYPLQPKQALDEPWLENTLVLVLATEEVLTPELQLRFLTFLAQGGKVLGLSCSLCPAGIRLHSREDRRGQMSALRFTKADNTEVQLTVLASGRIYVREPHDGSVGEVELWGELSGQEKDMVIVRVTHGQDGGEAILCQVKTFLFHFISF